MEHCKFTTMLVITQVFEIQLLTLTLQLWWENPGVFYLWFPKAFINHWLLIIFTSLKIAVTTWIRAQSQKSAVKFKKEFHLTVIENTNNRVYEKNIPVSRWRVWTHTYSIIFLSTTNKVGYLFYSRYWTLMKVCTHQNIKRIKEINKS